MNESGSMPAQIVKDARTKIIWAVLFLLTFFAFSAALTVLYIKAGERAALVSRIKSLEADSRTAWGKVYDMQESIEDTQSEKEAMLSIQLYQTQVDLNECRAVSEALNAARKK